MSTPPVAPETFDKDVADEPVELVGYDFGLAPGIRATARRTADHCQRPLSRRSDGGQRRGGRGGGRQAGGARAAARVHIGREGIVTVMTGKVEGGQRARNSRRPPPRSFASRWSRCGC